jgi:sialidase-1
MAGLVRLPVQDRDILIFSNVASDSGRKNGTVWLSLDGGQNWPHHRLITPGPFAYSSLAVGKPNTPSAGYIYLLYEGSERDSQRPVGGTLVRFNLRWLAPTASFNKPD